MDDGDDGQQGDGEPLAPDVGGFGAEGEEDILAEDDAVAGGEAEQNGLDGDERGRQEARARVGELEVDLVAARARQHAPVLEADGEAGGDDERAHDPERQRQADAAGRLEDDARHGEDAAADDAADGDDVRALPVDVAPQRGLLGQHVVLQAAVHRLRRPATLIAGSWERRADEQRPLLVQRITGHVDDVVSRAGARVRSIRFPVCLAARWRLGFVRDGLSLFVWYVRCRPTGS